MKFSKTLGLVTAAFLSLSLQAAPALKAFPVYQCPAIGEEYEALLAKLETIKSSVKEGANCSGVALQVKTLEELLATERQKVLELIEAGRENPLTDEQSEQVRVYAEDLTKKVASLYDLFTGSNKCFRDDEAAESGLASMAGFVNEAARLTAALSGPWGTPIALGGHVVAGFMTGLDKVLKSRVGFDYAKPDQWKNYVQNLCTFHSYRDQIEHLLNPQSRLNQLRNLRTRLDANIALLGSRCEECQRIETDFENHSVSSPDVLRADQRFHKPFGTYMLYSVGIRRWVNKEIQRVERESASFWADVSGRHLLSQAREDLEQFLVGREAPKFLSHQVGHTARDFGAFQNFALNEGRALYDQLNAINPAAVTAPVRYYFADPVSLFKSLIVAPLDWSLIPADRKDEIKYSWTHYRDRGLSRLRTAQATLQTVQGFCSFFQHAGYYSSRIKAVCTGSGVRQMAANMSALDQELATVQLGGGSIVDLNAFDPGSRSSDGPRTPVDSLNLFVEQLQPN